MNGLESARLRLRHFSLEDVSFLTELDSFPEVRKYVLLDRAPTEEEVHAYVGRIMSRATLDERYGYWIAEEIESGTVIGWFHLRPERDLPGRQELGYRLHPTSWGKGFATEMGHALVTHALENYGIPEVVAIALNENKASISVMEKIGMRFERDFQYLDEHPSRIYIKYP